jgi:hypothetical protein
MYIMATSSSQLNTKVGHHTRTTLEPHSLEPMEQGVRVGIIARLARIVGAQRHAADTRDLFSWDIGKPLATELHPEILVKPAAIHSTAMRLWHGRLHVY